MLRLFVLVLALLNGMYFVWSQGYLRVFDFAPVKQDEPERMLQQVRPEALRLLSPDEQRQAEGAAKAAARPPVCLQAGPFNEAQSTVLRSALEAAVSVGAWALDAVVEPERWIVYMGKFANAEAVAKKRAELAALELKFEALTNPTLEPGLSLGGFATQAEAEAALEALMTQRGVHTARVVLEHPAHQGMLLKVPAADDTVRAQLDGLGAALAGKPLRRCQ